MTKDILYAVEIENAYLEKKLAGDNSVILYDEIKKCGFATLNEYFDLKREYLFSCLDFTFVEQTPKNCIAELWKIINDNVTEVCFVETQELTVYSCRSKPYNEEFCKNNNITVIDVPSGGGTIISNKGDIVIAIGVASKLRIDSTFILNNIASILRKYMDDVVVIGNDILVNDRKVCGMSTLERNGMTVCLAHFSFSNNIEMIKAICHLDGAPEKYPSFISGMDKEMLKAEVIQWLSST